MTEEHAEIANTNMVYFGSVLGKHSEVVADDGLNLNMISEDPIIVNFVHEKGPFGNRIPWDNIRHYMHDKYTDEALDNGMTYDEAHEWADEQMTNVL